MIPRINALILLSTASLLSFGIGCVPSTPGTGNQSGLSDAANTSTAAIVGRIASSTTSAKLLTAQADGCPDIGVTINNSPVSIEFDDDCAFVISGVEASELVDIRVTLIDLGISGTIELNNVENGELIEIVVDPTDDSLTISVARRDTPEPSDELPEIITENNVSISLPAGLYEQGLEVRKNNFTLVGVAGESCDEIIDPNLCACLDPNDPNNWICADPNDPNNWVCADPNDPNTCVAPDPNDPNTCQTPDPNDPNNCDCSEAYTWTIITGDVLVTKNNATFRNIQFEGTVELQGNNTHFINCCFGGVLEIFGNNTSINGDVDHGKFGDEGNNGDDDDGEDDGDS